MKKLMVIAALMCAAVAAQAFTSADFKLYGQNIKNHSGSAYTGSATVSVGSTLLKTVTVNGGSIDDSESLYDYGEGNYVLTLTLNDGDYTYTESQNVTVTGTYVGDPFLGLDFNGQGTANFNGSGSWTGGPSNTPEPTSGLLLLIGMAGLALKRKRA